MLLDYFSISDTEHIGVHLLYTPQSSIPRGPSDAEDIRATIERCMGTVEIFIVITMREADAKTRFAMQMAYCILQGKAQTSRGYRIVTVFPGTPRGESLAGDVYIAYVESRSFTRTNMHMLPAFLVAVLL